MDWQCTRSWQPGNSTKWTTKPKRYKNAAAGKDTPPHCTTTTKEQADSLLPSGMHHTIPPRMMHLTLFFLIYYNNTKKFICMAGTAQLICLFARFKKQIKIILFKIYLSVWKCAKIWQYYLQRIIIMFYTRTNPGGKKQFHLRSKYICLGSIKAVKCEMSWKNSSG